MRQKIQVFDYAKEILGALGMKGLFSENDREQREEAFLCLEGMRRKVPDLDYDRELASYREEKHGNADID